MENNHYLVTLPTSLISTIIELSITDEDDSDNMRGNRKSALKGELKKLYQMKILKLLKNGSIKVIG